MEQNLEYQSPDHEWNEYQVEDLYCVNQQAMSRAGLVVSQPRRGEVRSGRRMASPAGREQIGLYHRRARVIDPHDVMHAVTIGAGRGEFRRIGLLRAVQRGSH